MRGKGERGEKAYMFIDFRATYVPPQRELPDWFDTDHEIEYELDPRLHMLPHFSS